MTRTLLLGTSLLIATTLSAQADGSYYVKLFGGASDLRSDTLSFGGAVSDATFDTGVVAGGAFGYDYAGSPWRAEVEYAYRSSDVTPAASFGTGGDFASTALMVNGIYTFSTPGAVQPYVGVGLGFLTEVDLDIDAGPAAGEYEDSGVFAAQVIVGAAYPVSDRVDLYGELRYFTAGSQTLDGAAGAIEADYDSFDAIIGLTITF
ncbi:MAG: outer membrane beta-barrel protein [Pseudomonadota bacterium]